MLHNEPNTPFELFRITVVTKKDTELLDKLTKKCRDLVRTKKESDNEELTREDYVSRS